MERNTENVGSSTSSAVQTNNQANQKLESSKRTSAAQGPTLQAEKELYKAAPRRARNHIGFMSPETKSFNGYQGSDIV